MELKKRKVIFRADGNSEIGLGHVIRSLALAEMLKDDFVCEFATRFTNDFIQKEIDNVCSKTLILPQSDNLHFEHFLELLIGNEIVVLDNYFFTTEDQKKIKKKGCKLVCIDDLADKHFVADAIINQTGGISKEDYSVENWTQLYLGTQYALLRPEFYLQNLKIIEFNNLFIALGSGANEKMIIDVITSIIPNKFKKIDIVLNHSIKELITPLVSYDRTEICLHSGLNAFELKELMDKHSLAICSPSSIAYECMSSGMLLFLIQTVDNQKRLFNYLIESELAQDFSAFDLKNIEISHAEVIINNQRSLFNNRQRNSIVSIFKKFANA